MYRIIPTTTTSFVRSSILAFEMYINFDEVDAYCVLCADAFYTENNAKNDNHGVGEKSNQVNKKRKSSMPLRRSLDNLK